MAKWRQTKSLHACVVRSVRSASTQLLQLVDAPSSTLSEKRSLFCCPFATCARRTSNRTVTSESRSYPSGSSGCEKVHCVLPRFVRPEDQIAQKRFRNTGIGERGSVFMEQTLGLGKASGQGRTPGIGNISAFHGQQCRGGGGASAQDRLHHCPEAAASSVGHGSVCCRPRRLHLGVH